MLDFKDNGVSALCVIMLLANLMLVGLTVSKYWGWFIIPVFPAAPYLTPVQAIGVFLTLRIMTPSGGVNMGKYMEQSVGHILGVLIGGPIVLIILGKIFTYFL